MASEEHIVRRLRALIFVMFGLGIAAGIIGTGEVRFFVICFFIPAGWAYMQPRWPAIIIWIMWASTVGMLGFLLAIGGDTELLDLPSHWIIGAIGGLLFIGLPLVRRMGEAPPIVRGRSRIPEARIHRRD